MVDLNTLSRRELQALCKLNGVRANMTNLAMVEALQSLPSVDGIDQLPRTTPAPLPTPAAGTLRRSTARKAAAPVGEVEVSTAKRKTRKKTARPMVMLDLDQEEEEDKVQLVEHKAATSDEKSDDPVEEEEVTKLPEEENIRVDEPEQAEDGAVSGEEQKLVNPEESTPVSAMEDLLGLNWGLLKFIRTVSGEEQTPENASTGDREVFGKWSPVLEIADEIDCGSEDKEVLADEVPGEAVKEDAFNSAIEAAASPNNMVSAAVTQKEAPVDELLEADLNDDQSAEKYDLVAESSEVDDLDDKESGAVSGADLTDDESVEEYDLDGESSEESDLTEESSEEDMLKADQTVDEESDYTSTTSNISVMSSFTGVSVITDGTNCTTTAVDTDTDSGYHLLVVKDYSHTVQEVPNGLGIRTDPFMVGGHQWHIWYCPNGNEPSGAEFICLHPFLRDNFGEKIVEAKFEFSFVDQDKKQKPKEFFAAATYSFSHGKPSRGPVKFIKRDALERSPHLKADCFTIRCDIMVCKDLNTYDASGTTSDMSQHFSCLLQNKGNKASASKRCKQTFYCNFLAKKMEVSSESSDSESSDSEDENTNAKPVQSSKAVVAKKKEESSSSSDADTDSDSEESKDDSDDSSDESDEEPPQKNLKDSSSGAAKPSKVAKKESSRDDDSSEGSSDSDEESVLVKKSAQSELLKQNTQPTTGSKTVFVGNLSYSVDKEQVTQFFREAGEIIDVRVGTFNDGSSKGFAHVEFATAETAQKACELNGHDLMGRPVRLNLAQERGTFTPGSGRDNSSFKNPDQSSSSTAFIRGFDSALGEDEIRSSLEKHFSSCGKITRVSIPMDNETGVSKGMAHMTFSDSGSLSKAIELSGSDLGGFSLYVDEAKPGRSDSRGRRGRFSGRDSRGRRGGSFGGGRSGALVRQSVATASTGKKITSADDD